jgi:hypothetical protein
MSNNYKKNLLTTQLFLLFLVNIVASFLSKKIGLFDSSLFHLQMTYPTKGLRVGEDFITYYPEGISIISDFLHKISHGALILESLVWPLHFLLQVLLLKRFIEICDVSSAQFLFIAILFLESMFYGFLGTEPFSLLIALLLIFDLLKSLENERLNFRIPLLMILLIFLRWDRFFCVAACSFLFLIIAKERNCRINLKFSQQIMMSYLLVFFVFILFLYFYHGNYFTSVIENTFKHPISIAHLRSTHIYLDFNFFNLHNYFLIFIAFYLLIGCWILKKKHNWKQDYLYIFGFCVLPYSFTRPDIAHIFPFCFIAMVSIIYIFSSSNVIQKLYARWVILFIFIGLISSYVFYSQINVKSLNNSCDLINFENGRNYKSIFVGNEDYSNFVINFPILYLRNVNLLPATQYISDEPGIQNLCNIQAKMIQELRISLKPTIVFLNKSKIIDKGNSNYFSSCGLLENFFKDELKKIDECTLDKYQLNVYVLD